MTGQEQFLSFLQPDYAYGNRSPIEIIRITPRIDKLGLDAFESLDHDIETQPPYTTSEIMDKIGELRDNYHIVGDPKSTESDPKHFGVTILNKHLLTQEVPVPAIVMVTTDGSSLFDEELNPNNEGNAIDLAYLALAHPTQPIIAIECPGNGNSTDLTRDEYAQASKDGRLIDATIDDGSGKLIGYEAYETIQAMARALESEGLDMISHVSSNSTSIPYITALESALRANSMKRALLYNPTNISDRRLIPFMVGRLLDIRSQNKYQAVSKDPLRPTDELRAMAKKAMSDKPKRKIDQARASTHNPLKLLNQQRMFIRGNNKVLAAAVQIAADQLRHPDLKQTIVIPEFAAHYKRPEDFWEFVRRVCRLLGQEVEQGDIETLAIPLGEYGHAYYPTVRQTLENRAFNR